MTKEDLKLLTVLNRKIYRMSEKLSGLRAVAEGTTANISGMPHINSISDKTAIAGDIADTIELIESMKLRTVALYKEIHELAYSTKDPIMEDIIVLRFVNDLSWRQVAAHIGGGNTEEGCRSMFRRWAEANLDRPTDLTVQKVV